MLLCALLWSETNQKSEIGWRRSRQTTGTHAVQVRTVLESDIWRRHFDYDFLRDKPGNGYTFETDNQSTSEQNNNASASSTQDELESSTQNFKSTLSIHPFMVLVIHDD